MNTRGILLNHLDSGLEHWRHAQIEMSRPQKGWIRAIRKALAMTIDQLAIRLKTTPSRVIVIEKAEVEGNTTLKTLQKVAAAIECDFVYAFVPKKSLKAMLEERVGNVIKNRTKRSSQVDEQPISEAQQKEKIEEFVKSIMSKTRLLNSLWDEEKTKLTNEK